MLTVTREPYIIVRPLVLTMGIRIRTPMRGMHPTADKLRKELDRWFAVRGIQSSGNGFLRLHVIDMEGLMDIEVGLPVSEVLAGDERVRSSELPAGNYACLSFLGHGLLGNKALLQAMKDHNWVADRWDDPHGDGFACRCETALTDRHLFPLKKSWEIEVSIKLKGEK